MADAEEPLDLSRTDVMWILHAEGRSFVEMIPPMTKLGLLVCHEDHQKRISWGQEVCETCANTLRQTWKRYLARIGATKEDANEVRGKWLQAYETVAEICMRRYEQDIEVTTTRTQQMAITRLVDGQPVTTMEPVEITTTRRERKIHVALLRLYLEVRDKVARVNGLHIDKTARPQESWRKLLAAREVDPNGDAEPAN
jgi:hypothetical protein